MPTKAKTKTYLHEDANGVVHIVGILGLTWCTGAPVDRSSRVPYPTCVQCAAGLTFEKMFLLGALAR